MKDREELGEKRGPRRQKYDGRGPEGNCAAYKAAGERVKQISGQIILQTDTGWLHRPPVHCKG